MTIYPNLSRCVCVAKKQEKKRGVNIARFTIVANVVTANIYTLCVAK